MKNPLDELKRRKFGKRSTLVELSMEHESTETPDSIKLGFVMEKLRGLEVFVNKAPNTSYHFQIEKRIRMILDTVELD
jgi:hypothetical protein